MISTELRDLDYFEHRDEQPDEMGWQAVYQDLETGRWKYSGYYVGGSDVDDATFLVADANRQQVIVKGKCDVNGWVGRLSIVDCDAVMGCRQPDGTSIAE